MDDLDRFFAGQADRIRRMPVSTERRAMDDRVEPRETPDPALDPEALLLAQEADRLALTGLTLALHQQKKKR